MSSIETKRNLLLSQHTDSSVTGTLTPTTLATITIPGGSIGANGCLRVTWLSTFTNSANVKTITIKLGAIVLYSVTATTSNSNEAMLMLRNRNSQSAQVMNPSGAGPFGNSSSNALTCTIDTSVAQDLTVVATLANTGETITLNCIDVEVIRG